MECDCRELSRIVKDFYNFVGFIEEWIRMKWNKEPSIWKQRLRKVRGILKRITVRPKIIPP